ncbi:phosphate ABC transporter substrate-binding protein [bacterium]|nr:phosphate ABC transporter substrate-binding protein [bacterium]MBU1983167.1 phosphate ABC transporter substrate-binding protein [bacterium]
MTVSAQTTSLQIKGSDTMVHLMSSLGEAYMESHPNVSIAVTGGGSGTGIAALLNGTTDLCASSRMMKDKEIKLAEQKSIHPVSTVVGLDGLAVMVNKNNPVGELSLEQLRKIYTGEYTRWTEVGGPDQPIIVLSRESNSGTYVYFQEHVLEKADFTPKARLMPSTAAIVQSVLEDQWVIGYGGVAYAEQSDVKTVKVKATPESTAIAPTERAVHDGTYPIARPLLLYTNGEPKDEVKKFVDYCLSEAGQAIVVETGYMTVPKKAE